MACLPRNISLIVAALAAVLLAENDPAAAAPPPFDLARDCAILPPPSISKTAPIYPKDQLYADGEGWVQFMLTLSTDGHVREAPVLDFVGSPRFRDAARVAVLQWHFQPQLRNGAPSERFGVPVQITFAIRPSMPSSAVARALEAAAKVPDHNPSDRLAVLQAVEGSPMSIGDRIRLSIALAQAAKDQGGRDRALYYIRHAELPTNHHVAESIAATALTLRAELEASDGNLRVATCYAAKARELHPDGADNRSSQILADALGRLNDPTPLTARGEISLQPESEWPPVYAYWLSRAAFSVKVATGSIDKVRLVCPFDTIERAFQSGATWTLPPDNGGACAVFVFGAAGSIAELTETW